jgi:hypothetical protein
MPKVSFYLRNEDVEKWKAIEKKTAWVHDNLTTHVLRLKDSLYIMNSVDPIKRYDGTKVEVMNVDEYDAIKKAQNALNTAPVPTTDRVVMDNTGQLYGTDTQFCKHNAVKGMCKKGCK